MCPICGKGVLLACGIEKARTEVGSQFRLKDLSPNEDQLLSIVARSGSTAAPVIVNV